MEYTKLKKKRTSKEIKQDIITLYKNESKLRFSKLIRKANLSSFQMKKFISEEFLIKEVKKKAVYLSLDPKIDPFKSII